MEGKDQGSLVVCLQKPEIGYNLGLSQYKIKVSNWGQAQRITGDKPMDNWGQAQGSCVNWSMALTGDYPNLVT